MRRAHPASERSELAEAIAAFRSVFLATGSFSFAVNLLLLAPALYMLQVYDRVLSSRNEVTLTMLTVIVVGLFALEAALEFVRSRILIRAGAALDLKLNARVFDASFERSLKARDGNPAQALTDLTHIRQFLSGKGLFALFDAPWTPIFIVVIFLLHAWLGLFALLSALLLLALAYANERATGRALAEAGRLAQSANHYAASNLRNAEVIEAMGMLAGLRARWFARQARFLAVQAQASDRAAAIGAVTRFFRLTLQSAILGVGALLVIRNELTPGGMIAASILLGRALSPIDLAIATWRGLVAARDAYTRLNALFGAHPVRAAGISLPRPKGLVAVQDLVVAAPGSRTPILKGITFAAAAGTLLAVIGPSAAGKSTLARALVGVWPPMNGSVRLDAADVNQWNREDRGPWVGYLPQDVELFGGTIAENIARFGEPDSTRIVQAAQRAGVHEMILHLPQGYETPIGEGGMTLSGGQRQRVALARALYGEPALVVLDEPDASLDEAGGAALVAALSAMRDEGRTVIMMTHRRSLLRIADVVLVLIGGMIQSHGPREAVLKSLAARARQPAVSAPAEAARALESAA